MISLEKALEMLLENTKIVESEEVNLFSSIGRILRSDVISPIDSPPFPKSPLDGYAIRSKDTKELPARLKVVDKIFAGEYFDGIIKEGEALRIMTGAPIPEGADCILRQEDVTILEDNYIRFNKTFKEFENYCHRGEDFKVNDILLKRGNIIKSAEAMAIASIGIENVCVAKKPKVLVINTGDEIVSVGQELALGKIYNSNGIYLSARLSEISCMPKVVGSVCDNREGLIKAIKSFEDEADIIISTGGVSVGEKDIVQEVVLSLGYELLFWKVDIKPGSPMFAAKKGEKLYIGLSGTPVAAATTFELLCKPVLYKMMGQEVKESFRQGIMIDDYTKVSKKRRFLRVHINGENNISINGVYQSPGQVHTMINSNAILEVPPNTSLKKGDIVKVYV